MSKDTKGHIGVYAYARKTGMALNTIYQQIYLGKLPAKKIGRKWQIPIGALAARAAEPATEEKQP